MHPTNTLTNVSKHSESAILTLPSIHIFIVSQSFTWHMAKSSKSSKNFLLLEVSQRLDGPWESLSARFIILLVLTAFSKNWCNDSWSWKGSSCSLLQRLKLHLEIIGYFMLGLNRDLDTPWASTCSSQTPPNTITYGWSGQLQLSFAQGAIYRSNPHAESGVKPWDPRMLDWFLNPIVSTSISTIGAGACLQNLCFDLCWSTFQKENCW